MGQKWGSSRLPLCVCPQKEVDHFAIHQWYTQETPMLNRLHKNPITGSYWSFSNWPAYNQIRKTSLWPLLPADPVHSGGSTGSTIQHYGQRVSKRVSKRCVPVCISTRGCASHQNYMYLYDTIPYQEKIRFFLWNWQCCSNPDVLIWAHWFEDNRQWYLIDQMHTSEPDLTNIVKSFCGILEISHLTFPLSVLLVCSGQDPGS
jgi:hypothetical protein